jgi:hypothetical protein
VEVFFRKDMCHLGAALPCISLLLDFDRRLETGQAADDIGMLPTSITRLESYRLLMASACCQTSTAPLETRCWRRACGSEPSRPPLRPWICTIASFRVGTVAGAVAA